MITKILFTNIIILLVVFLSVQFFLNEKINKEWNLAFEKSTVTAEYFVEHLGIKYASIKIVANESIEESKINPQYTLIHTFYGVFLTALNTIFIFLQKKISDRTSKYKSKNK